MKEKISEHIKHCCKCIAHKILPGKMEGFVNMISKENEPFQILHIDHVSMSDSRVLIKKFILVIVGAFTKFTKLYPTESTTSTETIVCLKNYFNYYSKPNCIISDRGPCFTANEFTDFIETHDIKHVKLLLVHHQ